MKKIEYNSEVYEAGNDNFAALKREIRAMIEKPFGEVINAIKTGTVKMVTGIDVRGVYMTPDGDWAFMYVDNGINCLAIWRDGELYA